MLYIIYGADDYAVNEALATLKTNLGDPEDLATNTIRLEGQRLPPSVLQTNVEAFPFFGEKRLVIVDGLLGRFDTKTKTKNSSAKNPNKTTDDVSSFVNILKSAPPSTVTVLIDGELKKTNILLKALADKADIKECLPMPPSKLPEWVKKRTAAIGATISDEAAIELARLVGPNLWVLSSEIEKLSLFTEGQRIEIADVNTVVAASREVGIFELVDAIMSGRSIQAMQLLQGFLRDGQAPSYIIFMLARQLRLMVRTKSMLGSGMSDRFIQDRLKLYGFALNKTIDQASRFSLPRLKTFYRHLLETDLSIKTSRYDESLAISLLVAETCGAQASK